MTPKLSLRRRTAGRLGLAAMLLAPCRAGAAAVWSAATEYPATAMPGEGLATLARLLAEDSAGAIILQPAYDAPDGLRSATMPAAVQAGRVIVGDSFGGALGGLDPVFSLSSLPFVATDMHQARRLYDGARVRYAAAFAALGQRLLYATPWPPTGIWSRAPVHDPKDLQGLAIRTYDAAGTAVFARAGASPVQLSFADAIVRLQDGSLAAVLSSGDGGAGRRLWDHLPHFTAIGYAMPLSFTTLNDAAWNALEPDLRAVVDQAAAMTEAAGWQRLQEREARNQADMLGHGMTIDRPGAALTDLLRRAAQDEVAAWVRMAGPGLAALIGQ